MPVGVRLAAVVSGAVLGVSCAAANAAGPRFHDGHGLRIVSQKRVDPRLLTLSVKTSALAGPANVQVLLPAGYAAHPRRRYPVFYLIHGTSGGANDWTEMGGAEKTTAGKPLIVVMPDIALNRDGGGWCTNWWNDGKHGQPEWERFHIDQLIPWIDSNLRTRRNREGRAIAGLSQGGFCSMSYAARHPDLFATALSYSGAPDIASPDPDIQAGSTAIINATEVGLDHVPANSMFGDRSSEEVNWAAHDPWTLAENLRSTTMRLYTGNGQPGPLDKEAPNGGAMAIEGAVERDSIAFHDRLEALKIPSFWDDYGPGTHTWPYWARDLRESIGPIMDSFAHPPARPGPITYTSGDDAYSAYGWKVTMHRTAREFSTLSGANARGFSLAGSGSATVVTPAGYRPRGRYRVTFTGKSTRRVVGARARRDGRLRLEVALGPSNPYQQYTAEADAAGTAVYTTRVAIQKSTGM